MSLSDHEIKEIDNARRVFEDLLNDFNNKGILRKDTPHDGRIRLRNILVQSMHFNKVYNEMIGLFRDQQQYEALIANVRNFGISDTILTYSFFSQAISTFLFDVEIRFRASLVFFLKEKEGFDKKMSLGQLIRAINKISPSIGERLKPLIDIDLRNALVHGTFWFISEGESLCISPDSYLETIDTIQLKDFLLRVKKQNNITQAFTQVLFDKIDQGYFK